MSPKSIKRIRLNIPDSDLKGDLDGYCSLAVDLGASDAQAIGTKRIIVDDRVILKCRIPKCFGYGTSAHCPPHSLKPDETRGVLVRYRWAVVFRLNVPS